LYLIEAISNKSCQDKVVILLTNLTKSKKFQLEKTLMTKIDELSKLKNNNKLIIANMEKIFFNIKAKQNIKV